MKNRVGKLFQEVNSSQNGDGKELRREQFGFVSLGNEEINLIGVFKAPFLRREIEIDQTLIISIGRKKWHEKGNENNKEQVGWPKH